MHVCIKYEYIVHIYVYKFPFKCMYTAYFLFYIVLYVVPYVHGRSERLGKVCTPLAVRPIFKPQN